jgi:hypothetical protein
MVTKRTGRPVGRPRKEKPPPRPAHRPAVPFLEDPDRYRVAAFLATQATTKGGAKLFATFYFGDRIDDDEAATIPIPANVRRLAKDGFAIRIFRASCFERGWIAYRQRHESQTEYMAARLARDHQRGRKSAF